MRSKSNYEIVNKEKAFVGFKKTCAQVGPVGLLDVKQDSILVHAVDGIMQHGLRDPVRGYWSLVRSLTHSTTLKSLEAFVKYISSSHQKGLAWTLYTMEEGSLEYYLASLLQDTRTVQQHYLEQSVLRDPDLSQQVVAAICTLRAEAAAIQASMESSLVSECALDSTPSLTSPVDSGVALIDSDNSTSDAERNEDCIRAQSSEHGAAWKQLGSSVATEASISSDNTLADDDCTSDLNNANCPHPEPPTDNQARGGIITQNKYEGVCRRPRKKKKSESGKRVSFHQDSNDDSDTVVLRHNSNLNQFYVEGRYSWAGEGDEFFTKENGNFRQVKSEVYENRGMSSGISIFDSELAIEADCNSSTSTLDDAKHNIEIVCEKLTNAVKQSLGLKTKEKPEEENINRNPRHGLEGPKPVYKSMSMAERGVPEGQEDPGLFSEYEHLLSAHQRNTTGVRSSVDLTSDSEWSVDTPDRLRKKQHFIKTPGSQRSVPGQPSWPARVLYETPSKTSLVKRFLRSIPTRKVYKEKKPPPKPCLYIKGVKPDPALVQEVQRNLEDEVKKNQALKEEGDDETVTAAMKTALEETVLLSKEERIYKVYRVASTEGEPLLAVLTDTALYMAGLGAGSEYSRRHHISYLTLNTVMIGPEYQTVMLVTVNHSVTVTVISALGQALVTHMVSHLALAVLRASRVHLSVCQLSLSGMEALYKAVLTQTSVTKDEKFHYYRYIRVEDTNMAGSCGPLGPSKSGHLMYRPHRHSPWLPGYILLKGGMLYVFNDISQQTPEHMLSFHRGFFGGCRRVYNSNRPHTFEIMPFCQRGYVGSFQFAAADDYESSEWLQAFIQTSSIMSQNSCEEPLVGCGLLLTSKHLLTLDFPDTVLSCARLQDISAIRTATTCCLLETSCREVEASGGDWILYFLTQQAIQEFLDTIYLLRPELKQAVVDSWDCEALHAHCLQTSLVVRSAWDPLLSPSSKQLCR